MRRKTEMRDTSSRPVLSLPACPGQGGGGKARVPNLFSFYSSNIGVIRSIIRAISLSLFKYRWCLTFAERKEAKEKKKLNCFRVPFSCFGFLYVLVHWLEIFLRFLPHDDDDINADKNLQCLSCSYVFTYEWNSVLLKIVERREENDKKSRRSPPNKS